MQATLLSLNQNTLHHNGGEQQQQRTKSLSAPSRRSTTGSEWNQNTYEDDDNDDDASSLLSDNAETGADMSRIPFVTAEDVGLVHGARFPTEMCTR
jgi:hypothetical protein